MAKKPIIPKKAKPVGKKKTVPESLDWGPNAPRDHLAYLNTREMEYLQQLRSFKGKREYNGVPAFPDPGDTAAGDRGQGAGNSKPSGSGTSGGGGKGPGGPSGPNSGPSGGSGGLGGGGKGGGPGGPSGPNSGSSATGGGNKSGPGASPGAGGMRGAGSNTGPGSARPGSDGGFKAPSSPMGGQGSSFNAPSRAGSYNKDQVDRQRAVANDARNAVKNTPSVQRDLSSAGIKSINVGPIGTPVSVSNPAKTSISRSISQAAQKSTVSTTGGWGVMGIGNAFTKDVPAFKAPNTATEAEMKEYGLTREHLDAMSRRVSGGYPGPKTPKSEGPLGKGWDERVEQTYTPSSKALAAVTRGPGSVSGSMPGNTDPVAAQRSIQGITNSYNEQYGTNYTPKDFENLARTIAGEAANQSQFGQEAVANTMFNRMEAARLDPEKYGYMGGTSINKLMGQYDAAGMRPASPTPNEAFTAANPGTEEFRRAMNALSDVRNPQGDFAKRASQALKDATHYHVSGMKNPPSWSGSMSEKVGSHVFGNAEKIAEDVRVARESGINLIGGVNTTATAAMSSPALAEDIKKAQPNRGAGYGPFSGPFRNSASNMPDVSVPDRVDLNDVYGPSLPERERVLSIENVPPERPTYAAGTWTQPYDKPEMRNMANQGAVDALAPIGGVSKFSTIGGIGDIYNPNAEFSESPKIPNWSQSGATRRTRSVDMENSFPSKQDAETPPSPSQDDEVNPEDVPSISPTTQMPPPKLPETPLPVRMFEKTLLGKIGKAMHFGIGKEYENMTPAEQAAMMTQWTKNKEDYLAGRLRDQDRSGKREEPESTEAEDDKKKKGKKDGEKKTSSGNRPAAYYYWDAGVNIPSPGDSDYTLYLKYLQEREAAIAAIRNG